MSPVPPTPPLTTMLTLLQWPTLDTPMTSQTMTPNFAQQFTLTKILWLKVVDGAAREQSRDKVSLTTMAPHVDGRPWRSSSSSSGALLVLDWSGLFSSNVV